MINSKLVSRLRNKTEQEKGSVDVDSIDGQVDSPRGKGIYDKDTGENHERHVDSCPEKETPLKDGDELQDETSCETEAEAEAASSPILHQMIKVPVNFNDSTLSAAPASKKPSPGASSASSRPST